MLTGVLAAFIAGACNRSLPEAVEEKATLHILDTVAAMVSGSQLAAGKKIKPFIDQLGGTAEATVIGSRTITTAGNAALANGMMAHADETDDSHAPSLNHPGCATIPAALAVAEREGASGAALLRAVVAGYDVGTRISAALGGGRFFDRHHSSHAFGGVFGATAASSVLFRLDPGEVSHALAYAVQQAAGNTCWRRDPDHVEKAFIFGGMPAQHGVLAALLASEGFVGSSMALEGRPGLFSAFPDEANPELAVEELGTRFEVMRTTIKKWCVGSPIQSALDALSHLVESERFTAADIAAITVSLPTRRAQVVQNPKMPDLNLAYQLAVLLTDGDLSFAASHDHARMADPEILKLSNRIAVRAEDGDAGDQAVVVVELTDGRRLQRQSKHVRGTPGNPMTVEEVRSKAQDLIVPVLGVEAGNRLVEVLSDIKNLRDVRELRPMLQR